MECTTAQEQISALLDSQLALTLHAELFSHIALCEECRAFLTSALRIREAVVGDRIVVPRSMDKRILGRMTKPHGETEEKIRGPGWWRRPVPVPVPIVLATALLVVGVTIASIVMSLRIETRPDSAGSGVASRGNSVVVVYQMPEEEVVGTAATHSPAHRQKVVD